MNNEEKNSPRDRENERGAAMIMALLVSFLLLVASAGLIMEASMNTANVTDAISEQEAYHSAESGIQSAVHVLRCQKNSNPGCADVRANPLLDTSVDATDPKNQITYNRALDPVTSNTTGQQDESEPRRLSRWMNYDGTCGPTSIRCVNLNNDGYGFALDVSDPDNTSKTVSFSMAGRLFENDSAVGGDSLTKTYGSGNNKWVIRLSAGDAVANHDMSDGEPLELPYGKFTIEQGSAGGAIIPVDNRFDIVVRMTSPFDAVKTIRGWIRATTSASERPKIIFDSQTLTLAGSAITLNLEATPSTGWSNVQTFLPIDPEPAGYMLGYQGTPSFGSGTGVDNIIGGTISAPEPIRLLIKSTGFGPRGARKELQAIIQKNFFNGLTAPAALTLVGPHRTGFDATLNPTAPVGEEESHFFFALGNSAVLKYSGVDQVSTDIIPPIGTSNPTSLDCVENYILGVDADDPDGNVQCIDSYPNGNVNVVKGNIEGSPSDINIDLPYWLQSPENLDREIHKMALRARASGRFFADGETPSTWGDVATGAGITFCDGDVELGQGISGDGGGILIVTGSLKLRGAFNFKGLIIVTGRDGLLRSGGGGGDAEITGNVVVAPYQNSKIVDRIVGGVPIDDPAGISLAPHYDMSGGGNSNLQFNSASLQNGLLAISNFVLGVVEK